MNRSLRITRRPFIAIAIVLSPVVLIAFSTLVQKGLRSDLVLGALLPFVAYAALMLTICSTRVRVGEQWIDVTTYFLFHRFIPFASIDHSDVQILAEGNHPAFVTVHYDDKGAARAMTLRMKPYDRDDVLWFCSLTELKARIRPGLTRRA